MEASQERLAALLAELQRRQAAAPVAEDAEESRPPPAKPAQAATGSSKAAAAAPPAAQEEGGWAAVGDAAAEERRHRQELVCLEPEEEAEAASRELARFAPGGEGRAGGGDKLRALRGDAAEAVAEGEFERAVEIYSDGLDLLAAAAAARGDGAVRALSSREPLPRLQTVLAA